MIKSSKHVTIIYTNHEINPTIATKTKLSIINIDKLNLKLIKTFTYFFQFRIKMRHRFEKFNVISNALSRLSMKSFTKKKRDSLNIDAKNPKIDQIYAYAINLMKMHSEFRKILINDYSKNLV